MRNIFFLSSLFVFVFAAPNKFDVGNRNKVCQFNRDSLYNSKIVFDSIINAIKSVDRKTTCEIGKKGELKNLFIYDLVDTSNFQDATIISNSRKKIQFINRHIYHFSCVFFDRSFSNILYLENGKIIIFKSINCKESQDNIKSVITFLKPKLSIGDSNLIVDRLKNYRKFGKYFGYDNYSYKLKCNCDPCE